MRTPPVSFGLLRGDLRASFGDAVASSLMLGLGESYVGALVLALGAADATVGPMVTLPYLGGALLQLLTPSLLGRVGSLRRVVVGLALVQVLALSGLAAVSFLAPRHALAAVLGLVSLYWAAGLGAGTAWNLWMEDLVPRRIRAGHLARRSQLAQAAVLLAMGVAAAVLAGTSRRGAVLSGLGVLFLLAALARLASAGFLSCQSEARRNRAREASGAADALAAGRGTRPLLAYLAAAQLGIHLAAGFFAAYMLRELALDHATYVALLATPFLSRSLVLPLLGRVARHVGGVSLLRVGGLAIALPPFLWSQVRDVPTLFAVEVLSGICWATFELGTLLTLMEGIPRDRRSAALTGLNLCNALGMACGAAAGALLLRQHGASAGTYAWLFELSAALRLVAWPLLLGVPSTGKPLRGLVPRVLSIHLRGLFLRPVLAGVGSAPPEEGRAAGR